MIDLNLIKTQIDELETFKSEIERQQLKYPIDEMSLNVTHKDVVIQQGEIVAPYDSVIYSEPFEVSIDGKEYVLESTPVF